MCCWKSSRSFKLDPTKLNHLYILSNASSGASGTGASTSFSASGSSSAGSNALTGTALYSPAANTLAPPSNALSAQTRHHRSRLGRSDQFGHQQCKCRLSAFSHFEKTTEPLSINHQGQFPAVTVSFNLAPNASLGDAIIGGRESAERHAYAGQHSGRLSGNCGVFSSSLTNEPLLILAALVTVYIVLGVLYENFIHPMTILSTLPSAGVGAFLALILFRQDLSVVAIIGIVLLIGIVKKNGIMMVDFALEAEREARQECHRGDLRGLPAALPSHHDDHHGCAAGRVPLAFGSGIGSELRRPLGIAMVGGLIFSQVLTLYTTPVIYIFFDNLAHRFSRKSAGAEDRRPSRGLGSRA